MHFLLTLADASMPPGTEGTIGAFIGLLGGGGFSLWYGWYMTAVAMPRKEAENAKNMNEIVTKFDASLREIKAEHKEEIATFWAEMKEERLARRQDTTAIVAAIRELKDKA